MRISLTPLHSASNEQYRTIVACVPRVTMQSAENATKYGGEVSVIACARTCCIGKFFGTSGKLDADETLTTAQINAITTVRHKLVGS